MKYNSILLNIKILAIFLALIFFSSCNSSSDAFVDFTLNSKDIKLDPFGRAPLAATLNVTTPIKTYPKVTVKGKEGGIDITKEYKSLLTEKHSIPIIGLYPNYKNTIEIAFYDASDIELYRQSMSVITQDEKLKPLKIRKKTDQDIGFIVSSNFGGRSQVYDKQGEIRAVFKTGNLSIKMKNGNYISFNRRAIIEFKTTGELVNSIDIPDDYTNIHHDIIELPSNNLLVLTSKKKSVIKTAKFGELNTMEDFIIEIDRSTGKLIKEIDLRKYYDVDRFNCLFTLISETKCDWLHANSVAYDSADDGLIISGRNQGVIKIGYTDEKLKWVFAPHIGFDFLGANADSPIDYEDYFLTAVDKKNKPYNQKVQKALDFPKENEDPFHWCFGQHHPIITSSKNGILEMLIYNNQASLILDNENKSNHCTCKKDNTFPGIKPNNRVNDQTDAPYSLATLYRIDENKKTIKEIKSYNNRSYSDVRCGVGFIEGDNQVSMFSAKHGTFTIFEENTDKIVFESSNSNSGRYRMFNQKEL